MDVFWSLLLPAPFTNRQYRKVWNVAIVTAYNKAAVCCSDHTMEHLSHTSLSELQEAHHGTMVQHTFAEYER